jgi:hypothetical protein
MKKLIYTSYWKKYGLQQVIYTYMVMSPHVMYIYITMHGGDIK